jgi:hypothetical protein
MGSLQGPFDVSVGKPGYSAWQYLQNNWNADDIQSAKGQLAGLVYEDVVVADTGALDTEFTVPHNLGVIPSGVYIIRADKAGSLYDSGTAYTDTDIYLKLDAANAALTLRIVV